MPFFVTRMKLNELRIKLDQLTETLISRIKDRSRFPLNHKVYEKGVIVKDQDEELSFFEYALRGLEQYHHHLGRYKYEDQYPLFSDILSDQVNVDRLVPEKKIPQPQINIGHNILNYYPEFLRNLCEDKDDPYTYGETVYCDADLILLLNERINVGRFVAQTKLKANPELLHITDNEEIRGIICDLEREKAVVEKAKAIAIRYELPENLIGEFFRWIIEQTIGLEITYIKKIQDSGN